MNRREAIERTAMILGSATALAGVMNGCKAKPELVYKPVFFTEDQARTVSEIAQIIIPKTTTAGAKEAGVPAFIDSMLKEVYSKDAQERFIKGLADFEASTKKTYGESFTDCQPSEQLDHVKKQHAEAVELKNPELPFILSIKELTLLGFFTSQPGATEVLQYNQVPGPYQGCVDLRKVGKAWAT